MKLKILIIIKLLAWYRTTNGLELVYTKHFVIMGYESKLAMISAVSFISISKQISKGIFKHANDEVLIDAVIFTTNGFLFNKLFKLMNFQ